MASKNRQQNMSRYVKMMTFLNVSALNSGIRFLNKNKDFSFVKWSRCLL